MHRSARTRLATLAAGIATLLGVALVPGLPAGAHTSESVRLRSAAESFVHAAYQDIVDRPPTPGEEVAAAAALASGASRRAFIGTLVRSPEWAGSVVQKLYVDTLGRPGDPGGVAFWADRVRIGAITVAEVAARFYASPEYFAGRGGGTVGTWVDDVYLRLLERPSDPGGRAYWSAQTEAQGRTRVAHRFFQSPESARARVRGLYRDLLGRTPDASGLEYWAGRVLVEGDLALAVELAVSAEYAARAQLLYP